MGGLTVKDLIEYLEMFPGEEELRILAANPKERLFFEIEGVGCIMDAGVPVLCIEVEKAVPMDEEMVQACEEAEELEEMKEVK